MGFVYSYAVFQHISRAAKSSCGYLREAVRVLVPGGLFVFQINGLPAMRITSATTWDGVRDRRRKRSSAFAHAKPECCCCS